LSLAAPQRPPATRAASASVPRASWHYSSIPRLPLLLLPFARASPEIAWCFSISSSTLISNDSLNSSLALSLRSLPPLGGLREFRRYHALARDHSDEPKTSQWSAFSWPLADRTAAESSPALYLSLAQASKLASYLITSIGLLPPGVSAKIFHIPFYSSIPSNSSTLAHCSAENTSSLSSENFSASSTFERTCSPPPVLECSWTGLCGPQ